MAENTVPVVDCDSVNPGFIVGNIAEAVAFYSSNLGFKLGFTWGDPPQFAGMNLGKVSIHLMTQEGKTGTGMAYFAVDNADDLYLFHQQQGVEITEPIANRDYSMRDYQVRDPFGNYLGFGHYIMSNSPSLLIERTDVLLRLEKRLANLLKDLAVFKGMSLDSLMEETFLHTFEPMGDGVASPHTKTQLRHIEELKRKHGIDYDVHASYRFVEAKV